MMRLLPHPRAATALCFALLLPAAATADGSEAVEHKQVHIKKIVHECEGDGCEDVERHRKVIVLGGDGEALELDDEHVLRWVGAGGMEALTLPRHGKGGFLGIATTDLTPELRRHFGVPEEAGVLVARVVDGSAAAAAGIQVGDILSAVAGKAIASQRDLVRAVGQLEPGAAVDLELYRDGILQTLGATLGERSLPHRHAVVKLCADRDAGCPEVAALEQFDCGGDSECEVRVECRDDGCDCTVNGESAECETLPGFVAPGG